ncbi:Condensin complex subunit 2 [Plasmodiophora brassicae]
MDYSSDEHGSKPGRSPRKGATGTRPGNVAAKPVPPKPSATADDDEVVGDLGHFSRPQLTRQVTLVQDKNGHAEVKRLSGDLGRAAKPMAQLSLTDSECELGDADDYGAAIDDHAEHERRRRRHRDPAHHRLRRRGEVEPMDMAPHSLIADLLLSNCSTVGEFLFDVATAL